jgi:hypothetical protein
MRDFLAFRTMLTPILIQVIFWVGVLICVAVGLVYLGWGFKHETAEGVYKGLAILILGPIGIRIYCEILIIFFRINETLTEIKHDLEERRPPQP